LERYSRELAKNGAEQESISRRAQIIINLIINEIDLKIMLTPVHTVPKMGVLSFQNRIVFTVPLTTSPADRVQSGGEEERGRSNMATPKYARENVLQDNDTRFVNTTNALTLLL